MIEVNGLEMQITICYISLDFKCNSGNYRPATVAILFFTKIIFTMIMFDTAFQQAKSCS